MDRVIYGWHDIWLHKKNTSRYSEPNNNVLVKWGKQHPHCLGIWTPPHHQKGSKLHTFHAVHHHSSQFYQWNTSRCLYLVHETSFQNSAQEWYIWWLIADFITVLKVSKRTLSSNSTDSNANSIAWFWCGGVYEIIVFHYGWWRLAFLGLFSNTSSAADLFLCKIL